MKRVYEYEYNQHKSVVTEVLLEVSDLTIDRKMHHAGTLF